MIPRYAALAGLLAAVAAGTVVAEPIHGSVTTRDGRQLSGILRWDRNECFWDDYLETTTVPVADGEPHGFRLRMFGLKLVDTTRTRQRGLRLAFGHLRSIEVTDEFSARLVLKSGEVIAASADGTTDLGPAMRGVEVLDGRGPATRLAWHEIARVDFGTPPPPEPDPLGPRLHGTVTTIAGVFTGFLVWDKEWVLATDPVPCLDPPSSGGRPRLFADLLAIDHFGGARVHVRLIDGTTVASAARRPAATVEITVPGLGRVSVPWDAVRQVVFSTPPPTPSYGEFDGGRLLAGRVVLTDGSVRSGGIVWDDDETSTEATLDAEVDGIEYSIPFARIAEVTRLPEASRVRLRDGREIVLRGTNDVNDANRGIGVIDAAGGRENVEWARVASVELAGPE